jgi:hypothetical protein
LGYGVLGYGVLGYGVLGYGVLGYGVLGYGVLGSLGWAWEAAASTSVRARLLETNVAGALRFIEFSSRKILAPTRATFSCYTVIVDRGSRMMRHKTRRDTISSQVNIAFLL